MDGKSIEAKIEAVREVIPNKSNHELTLVLQYYDYNINEAIAAILEDGASAALKAWNYDRTKVVKKKPKKQSNNKSEKNLNEKKVVTDAQDISGENKSELPEEILDSSTVESDVKLNGTESTSSVAAQASSSRKSSYSERESLVGFRENEGGKIVIDKSMKDLGRHWHSLQRTQALLVEEFEKSEKRLHLSFRELHQLLESREAELTKELSRVKSQAKQVLEGRLDHANSLKMKATAAETLSNVEINDLRADIKQFVGDRKLDEELGKAIRFIRNHEQIKREISEYGEITPVKMHYVNRKHSVSSTTSLSQSEPSEIEWKNSSLSQNAETNVNTTQTSSSVNDLSQGFTKVGVGQPNSNDRSIVNGTSQSQFNRRNGNGIRKFSSRNRVFNGKPSTTASTMLTERSYVNNV
ncbi:Spermatoproteinsis associated, serine-rich [Chamberlinius hualienensis]